MKLKSLKLSFIFSVVFWQQIYSTLQQKIEISKSSSIEIGPLPAELKIGNQTVEKGWPEFLKWHENQYLLLSKLEVKLNDLHEPKNVLAAKIGFIFEDPKDKKYKILSLDIPYYFLSGWNLIEPIPIVDCKNVSPNFYYKPLQRTESSSNTLKTRDTRRSRMLDARRSIQSHDQQSSDPSTITLEAYVRSNLKDACYTSGMRGFEEYTKELKKQLFKPANTDENVPNQALFHNELTSELEIEIDRSCTKQPGYRFHVDDSEQALFFYLFRQIPLFGLLSENEPIKEALKNNYVLKGITLNVSTRLYTCLDCNLFYNAHLRSSRLVDSILTSLKEIAQEGLQFESLAFNIIISSTKPLSSTVNLETKNIFDVKNTIYNEETLNMINRDRDVLIYKCKLNLWSNE